MSAKITEEELFNYIKNRTDPCPHVRVFGNTDTPSFWPKWENVDKVEGFETHNWKTLNGLPILCADCGIWVYQMRCKLYWYFPKCKDVIEDMIKDIIT